MPTRTLLCLVVFSSLFACSRRQAPVNREPGSNPAILLAENGGLQPGDVGEHDVAVEQGDRVRIRLTSDAFDPTLQVVPPSGQRLRNDDANGDRSRSEIELVVSQAGRLKIVADSSDGRGGQYRIEVERLAVHAQIATPRIDTAHPRQIPNLPGSAPSLLQNAQPTAGGGNAQSSASVLPVRLGDRVSGNLTAGDSRLPEGQSVDYYILDVREAQELTIQMQSSAVDSFLIVVDAHGERHENDDSGGAHDAQLVLHAEPGQYRIACTTYRAGEQGAYTLKVLTPRDVAAGTAPASTGTPAATNPAENAPRFAPVSRRGTLQRGDLRVDGKYYDSYPFTLEAGQRIRIEVDGRFDSVLQLRGPNGVVADNDDREPGNLNAGLDFVVPAAGRYEIRVTSYAEGETGAYTLDLHASTSAATGTTAGGGAVAQVAQERTSRGTLAAGDRRLGSGEFNDTYEFQFAAGVPVTFRLESRDFDAYMFVRSPSGHQDDNDDVEPNNTNSEIVLQAAETGTYRVVVTSYRPGETGAYSLRVTPGNANAGRGNQAAGANPSTPGNGTRVWAVSVGITDYPSGINDLPQCANDARRISETLHTQNLTQSNTDFLFTDGQATVSAVRSALTQVAREAGPDDVIVFFYSGHGGQDARNRTNDENELDGVNEYLVLYDGRLLDDELGRLFTQTRARVSLVALDACFSGGFAKDVVRRPGIVGMFSSEEDVTSAVASRFQAGGYLSHFLRVGMEGQADQDPRDGVLTVGELTHFVWQQYGAQASDVRMSEGYQQLVVDRGAVRTGQLLWRPGR